VDQIAARARPAARAAQNQAGADNVDPDTGEIIQP
jgi:hypothetical protein